MSRWVYSEEDLLREPAYAAPHVAAGYRLHGGFDAQGRYLSPRSALRPRAVRAWQARLRAEGFALLEADPSLFPQASYPSFAQMRLLLERGVDQGLWNSLSITGLVEARGRVLCDLEAPDFQPLVEQDLRGRALGHLNRGLLRAHGLDEGGDEARGLGGHDAMWFAIRDLVLGPGRYPVPPVPPRIGRPEDGRRLLPELPARHEGLVLLLMNVLLVEVRAEILFVSVERLLSEPTLFRDRREEAREALALVGRIRQDETVHVEYLRTVLSELRALDFRLDHARRRGADLLDPVWHGLVHWHTVDNPRLARTQQRELVRERVLARSGGEALWREFLALEHDLDEARSACAAP
jgi:hypothetical protein